MVAISLRLTLLSRGKPHSLRPSVTAAGLLYAEPLGYSPGYMAGKYQLTTLGCKVNQYESQQIREVLESFGLHPAREGETPDVAVVNTCAVTAEACRKNRQAVRRAAHQGRTPVVVVGCGASADTERLRKLDGVAALLGHDLDACSELRNLLNHAAAQTSAMPGTSTLTVVGATDHRPGVIGDEVWIKPFTALHGRFGCTPRATHTSGDNMPHDPVVVNSGNILTARIERFAGHQRAFLKVQDGCDAPCTYCIVPRVRPRLRSKPLEVALAEARDLVHAGHKEIIVTGVCLGAYGRETAVRRRFSRTVSPLTVLVRALSGIDGLHRLRLSSLEPGDVDDSLLEVLATHRACVPHLHLPLQSGSDAVLRRMNRQYGRDEFVRLIERVKAALDRPAITTDVIVGFPGESEEDFAATLHVARQAELCKIHAFPFSPRNRTAAARWTADCVPRTEIRRRLLRLRDLECECSTAFRTRFIGEHERLIVERPHVLDLGEPRQHNAYHGRADRYFDVHFEVAGQESGAGGADEVRVGDLVTVRIERVAPTRTHGCLIRSGADSNRRGVASRTA